MNPTDVLFVVCTRFDAEQYKTTPTYTSLAKLEKLYGEIPTRVFYQNKRGLPECYNEAIRDCQQPFVVFIHDDIFINDLYIFDKLSTAFTNAHIIGLAGADLVNLRDGANGWWHIDRKHQSSCVLHTHKDSRVETPIFPPVTQQFVKCMVMDGLFLGCNVAALKEKQVWFDEQFTFDGYDFDFCLNARERGLVLMTWAIMVTHCSLGEGALEANFKEVGRKLFAKWRRLIKD
jgi:GT2 family glycosyltransferase